MVKARPKSPLVLFFWAYIRTIIGPLPHYNFTNFLHKIHKDIILTEVKRLFVLEGAVERRVRSGGYRIWIDGIIAVGVCSALFP